jgi:methylated-DNA-[protein]-cysteine S-methyltransferase
MARTRAFAIFATAIGDCAIAWSDDGVTGVWLPSSAPGALPRTIVRRHRDAVVEAPPDVHAALPGAIARLLAGERVDFDDVRLDLADADPFDARVYTAARAIRAGEVVSYGELAARVGDGATARDVGQSLGRNRWPIVVPCHRIVASGSGLGGFSAPGGTATKQRLLAIERARRTGAPDLFDALDAVDAPR